MAYNKEIEDFRILQGSAHEEAVHYRSAVVRNRNDACISQFSKFSQVFTSRILAYGSNRINAAGSTFSGPVQDKSRYRGVVIDRFGVGHAGHRRIAPGNCRPGSGSDGFLILITGFTQMNMHIHQAGHDPLSARIDLLEIRQTFRTPLYLGFNVRQTPVENQHICNFVRPLSRVKNSPMPEKKVCTRFRISDFGFRKNIHFELPSEFRVLNFGKSYLLITN